MNSITRNQSSFVLQTDHKEIANVKYNRENNSIRIFSSERRLFFLNNAGLLQNKILLTTEYGVTIGEIYPVKNNQKGVLHLGDHKFHYSIEKNLLGISDKRRQPVLNFNLEGELPDNYELAGILFTVTWLMVHSELNATAAHKASVLYAS